MPNNCLVIVWVSHPAQNAKNKVLKTKKKNLFCYFARSFCLRYFLPNTFFVIQQIYGFVMTDELDKCFLNVVESRFTLLGYKIPFYKGENYCNYGEGMG